MMKKRVITWALVFALTAAVPAFGIFGIPSPEDLLIWFVLRPMMHGNQRAMIANQVRELEKLVEQLETARSQLTQVRDGAQGLVGAITDPMADLVATSTDVLHTARDWHADFTGPAGDMVGSVRNFANNGESFSRKLARRVAGVGHRHRGRHPERLPERSQCRRCRRSDL